MKVALVHDFLSQYGGGERVLLAFLEIFPTSPVYTLIYDEKKLGDRFGHFDIKTSFIQKLPFGPSKYKMYLPLMPTAIESFNLEEFDLILSDSSSFSKGVLSRPSQLHICFCHTPTRFLWQESHYYLETSGVFWPFKKFLPFILTKLRVWDYQAAQRPDFLIANSETVRERIKKYYRRDSEVIHPFVETDKFKISQKIEDYFLIAGRIVPYKRYDIVISAFNKLKLPLKVAGDGYGLPKLKELAKSPKIEFLGRVSDEKLQELYSKCQALIFPALEDFGIVPLEAMASGRPVIAYKRGGALETMVEEKTGLFFQEQTPESLLEVMRKFKPEKFDPKEIRKQAQKFDKNIFKKKIKEYLDRKWKEWQTKK